MLLGGNKNVDTIVDIAPPSAVETILSVFYEIDSVLGKFIRGQLIEASFVGLMSVVSLSVIGVNFAIIIGIAAGLANMIPYMGPFIGFSFAMIVALVQFHSFIAVVKVALIFIAIQFLDNNFVQPLVVGRTVNLSPVAMIFAMLAGAQVFGFLGIVFAVPVAAMIKTVFFLLISKYKQAAA